MTAANSTMPTAKKPGSQSAPGRARARSEIALMAGYHSPQLDVEVRLNTNESPFPPPGALTDTLAAALRRVAWNRYPDRQASELRRRIAARHDVSMRQVFVANGSNEVLQCLVLAYAAAGGTAAVFEPTYTMHGHIARVAGAQLVRGRRGADFSVDAGAAARLVAEARPSLTFLCSPNNPTGVVDPPATIAAILDAVRAVRGLLCVDEAYGEFAARSALELLEHDPDAPLAVTRTFSKSWAMAAARLGYLIGPAWAVEELEKVVLPYHLDSVKQAVGIAALDHAGAMRARVEALVAERERLTLRLGELCDVWPSGANFILFRPRGRRARRVWQALVERSVLVRDCSSWPGFDGCLRVTVGTPPENDRFLDALSEILT